MSAGFYRVDGPPPARPRYGLLQAADAAATGVRIVPDADGQGIERWGNGVAVFPFPPDVPDVFSPCVDSSPPPHKGLGAFEDGLGEIPTFDPMTIWIAASCPARKVWSFDEFRGRAQAVFTAVESYGVAKGFKTGDGLSASAASLVNSANLAVLNSAAATSAMNGVTLLENAIAASGRAGLIHLSPAVAHVLHARGGGLQQDGGVLKTINGTVVVPDSGYSVPGTPSGEGAAADGQEWIYATGPVDIRRAAQPVILPEELSQALDRGFMDQDGSTANLITIRVERDYLVDWDTQLHATVLVDLCQTTC